MDSIVLVDPPIRDRIGPKWGTVSATNSTTTTHSVRKTALFHVKSR